MLRIIASVALILLLSIPASAQLKSYDVDPSKNYDPVALFELGAVSVTTDGKGRVIKYVAPEPLDFSKYDEALFRGKKKTKQNEIFAKYGAYLEQYYPRESKIDVLIMGGEELDRYRNFVIKLREKRKVYLEQLDRATTLEEVEAIRVDYSDIVP